MTWMTAMEYMCHRWPRICSTCRKHFPILSSFMTYHRVVTRLTRPVSLMDQELLTLPEHMSSPPVFSGVRVTRSLVLCVGFVDRCFFFCIFSFGHCVVCSSSIYGLWLPLWYLQTLLLQNISQKTKDKARQIQLIQGVYTHVFHKGSAKVPALNVASVVILLF
jgi:hypothetical protein